MLNQLLPGFAPPPENKKNVSPQDDTTRAWASLNDEGRRRVKEMQQLDQVDSVWGVCVCVSDVFGRVF